jgi:hypothetical protein
MLAFEMFTVLLLIPASALVNAKEPPDTTSWRPVASFTKSLPLMRFNTGATWAEAVLVVVSYTLLMLFMPNVIGAGLMVTVEKTGLMMV